MSWCPHNLPRSMEVMRSSPGVSEISHKVSFSLAVVLASGKRPVRVYAAVGKEVADPPLTAVELSVVSTAEGREWGPQGEEPSV